MSEVTELAANEIDRTAGVSAGGAAEQIYREENSGQAAPVEMTAEQQTGIKDLATMRARAGDPSLDSEQRSAILAKMGQLAQHVLNGKAKPDWYGEAKQNARDTSNAEHDSLAQSFETALEPMTQTDFDKLVTRGVVAGQLDRAVATTAADFCRNAQLPGTVANVVMDRAGKHAAEGFGYGVKLSDADIQELTDGAIKAFGSIEKAEAETNLARKYLESVGGKKVLDFIDGDGAGSLGFDPRIILQLSYLARVKGIK